MSRKHCTYVVEKENLRTQPIIEVSIINIFTILSAKMPKNLKKIKDKEEFINKFILSNYFGKSENSL